MTQQSLDTYESVESVIKAYADMVYRLAFARSGNRYDAEEIFQEVFFRYVRKSPAFSSEEHRKAWLIRVTINCASKLWASSWRKRTLPLDEDIVEEKREESSIDIQAELQKLPFKYREVVHLFYYEDMSLEEISKTLKRKSSTVRSQLSRARRLLRAFMKEEEYYV